MAIFYDSHGQDVGFDPEFSSAEAGDASRVQLKNINSLLHLEPADAGIASTHWQADTLPPRFRDRITVVYDGIDADRIRPNPSARLRTASGWSRWAGRRS